MFSNTMLSTAYFDKHAASQVFPTILTYLTIIMKTNSLQVVANALKLSTIASGNQQIHEATLVLSQESCKPGYLSILAYITREQQYQEMIVLAAFAQLKNLLRTLWNHHQFKAGKRKKQVGLTQEDRSFLIGSIIKMNITHVDKYILFKLAKDVNCLINDSIIQIMPQVIQLLQEDRYLKPCLNILLGMSENLRLENNQKLRQQYAQILKKVLPLVLNSIQKEQKSLVQLYWSWNNCQTQQSLISYNVTKKRFQELLYLSIKFAYKSIGNDLGIQLRRIYCEWAKISLGRLQDQDEDYNAGVKERPNFCGDRGSDSFNYFHGKKWSAKFMTMFLNRVMEVRRSKPEVSQITNNFYLEYGEYLKTTLRTALQFPQPMPVRYFQLRFLEQVFQKRKDLLTSELHFYLFEILPAYLDLSDADLSNMQNNPNDFMIGESIYDKNVKLLAISMWKELSKIGSAELQIEVKQAELLVDCFRKINEWLHDQSWRWKQIALYLLIQFGTCIVIFPRTVIIVKSMLELCLPNIFSQPCQILQLRGLELIESLGSIINKATYPILQEIILTLFKKRQEFHSNKLDLFSIKAGLALEKVLVYGYETIRNFSAEEIVLILTTILELLKNYEVTGLSCTLMAFLQEYPQEMSNYSVELVIQLSGSLKLIMQKECTNNTGGYVESATGITDVLILIARMIVKDGNVDVRLKDSIEQNIVELINYALFNQQQLSEQYLQGIMQLLLTYLNIQTNITDHLSDPISFYFLLFIFRFAPFNQDVYASISHSNRFTNQCKEILQHTNGRLDTDIQLTFQLFRNYLKFVNPQATIVVKNAEISPRIFELDFVSQFFYMFNYFYRNKEGEQQKQRNIYDQTRGRYLVTVTLCTLLEHHHSKLPVLAFMKILKIIQLNKKQKQMFHRPFATANMELLCVWVTYYQGALDLLSKQNDLLVFVTKMFHDLNKLPKDMGKTTSRRLVLGMIKIIQFSFSILDMQCMNQFFFTWIFNLVMSQLETEQETRQINEACHQSQDNDQSQSQAYSPSAGFFANNRDLQFQIDQDSNQDYIPLYTVDEAKHFLDFLIFVKANDPEYYEKHILQTHYYQVETLSKYAQAKYSPHYKQLFAEQGLNFQQK